MIKEVLILYLVSCSLCLTTVPADVANIEKDTFQADSSIQQGSKQNQSQSATKSEPKSPTETKNTPSSANSASKDTKVSKSKEIQCQFNNLTETCEYSPSSTDSSHSDNLCFVDQNKECSPFYCTVKGSKCEKSEFPSADPVLSSRMCRLDLFTGSCTTLGCKYNIFTQECVKTPVDDSFGDDPLVNSNFYSLDKVCNYDLFLDQCMPGQCQFNPSIGSCQFIYNPYGTIDSVPYFFAPNCAFLRSQGICIELE